MRRLTTILLVARIETGRLFLSSLEHSMTMPFQIYERVQELRREIAEITAADKGKRVSGPDKVNHEKRIQRLGEIRGELSALIWEGGWGQNFCRFHVKVL